jgi:hypothetical protein
MSGYLAHKRQEKNWGCIFHAAYAITHDESLLAYVDDISQTRYRIYLLKHGWVSETYWSDLNLNKADADVWERIADAYRPISDCAVFILDIDSLRHTGLHHAVAVEVPVDPGGRHYVSDSTQDELVTYEGRAEFLESPYARPYAIAYLFRADLQAWPVEDAETVFHEMKAAAAAGV